MKLDGTAKIVSMVSVIIGLIISVAGYIANRKIASLNAEISELKEKELDMDVSETKELKAARISAEFSIPLARTFATLYGTPLQGTYIQIPPALSDEFSVVMPEWSGRKGLMTGGACTKEGLKNRQVITLVVKNIGFADAIDVVVKVLQKKSPHGNPRTIWRAFPEGTARGYGDLWQATEGWEQAEVRIGEVRGLISPEEERRKIQVVLASVSGRDGLFGTILVPMEISWTDRITKEARTRKVDGALISDVRAGLFGAEIGSLRSACM